MLKLLKRLVRGRKATPEWVRRGELSSKGGELRYWNENGLQKGSEFYHRYLKLFGLDIDIFDGKTVADFGSGPFGGMISVLPKCEMGYPIDVLADEYNEWGRCPFPVIKFDGGATQIPAQSCDAVFCTNAIDHTPKPELIVNEIWRILKSEGKAFVHLHLRGKDELNKIHPFLWDRNKFEGLFSDFIIEETAVEARDWVNEKDLDMLYATLRKPAA